MSYTNVIVEKKHNIGTIIINRPQVLNALDKTVLKELLAAVEDLERDDSIKVALITGKDKAFVAGADIKQMKDMSPLEGKEFGELGHTLMHHLEASRLPYIAVVNGFALGGGCELMMACDIILAATTAKIGQPEINLGIHPGFGGTQRLPRLVGAAKAKELLFTGDAIEASEALRIGLVNKVVEPDHLMEEAEKLAVKLASKSSIQLQFIKELVNKGTQMSLASACAMEIAYFSSCFSTQDQKEGMGAFLEKRKPNFQGK
ncbi:MAG TPA: enoyl-CoA hydratase-related protein [Candidatus Thermoplasmatota archaeon]|nr:enoyl-CoA hydratase-related protein [Candidatus Thermoplasmatota archaeon]